MPKLGFFWGCVSVLLLSHAALAATEVSNADALRQKLGLTQYTASAESLAGLKIAILDNGFSGYVAHHGQLPDSAELIEGPQNGELPTTHGLGMAEIVWAMTGKLDQGPKFYLINSNGFTNLQSAVEYAIRARVDIVLYSQVWPFGSNFDGSGFINAAVNRATSAGILWINAAGNFGQMVYNGQVAQQLDRSSGQVRFGSKDYLEFENRLDENELSITLSWTDFADSVNYNTAEDLDLFVYDSSDRLVGSSELVQRGEAPPLNGESRLSSYPRETVKLRGLDRGTYRIRVRSKSDNFRATDLFRVLLQSEKLGTIVFTDHGAGNEIFAPADNPNVITVGEAFEVSAQGPTADGRVKPDVLLSESVVSFSNGTTVRGSSTAAALFTGAVALMKAARPDLGLAQLKTYLTTLQAAAGSSADLLPASPTAWPPLPAEVTALVPQGGSLMIAPNGHFVVLSPVDPLQLPQFQAGHAYRQHPDDILALDPYEQRWLAVPAPQAALIRAPLVEFRRLSAAPGMWRMPAPGDLARW